MALFKTEIIPQLPLKTNAKKSRLKNGIRERKSFANNNKFFFNKN
jgi:hypothetical protein